MSKINAPRFPKIHSPFEREERAGGYYVTEEENEDLSWFRSHVAVEKIEGTNCAVYIDETGRVDGVSTRMGQQPMNYVHPYTTSTNHKRIVNAVQNSNVRGWFDNIEPHDAWHYGEVVGPKIQGNPYELDEHLFVPFHRAFNRYRYKSWGEYGQSLDDIRQWFKDGLFSLFYADIHGTDLDTASVTNGTYVEGIMFTHVSAKPYAASWLDGKHTPDPDNYAKLRRDMFENNQEWPGDVHDH